MTRPDEAVNRQLVLRSRPTGKVTDDCFELLATPTPDPPSGGLLVRNLWLGFEPAQRGWLNDVRSYVPPVAIGEVMRAWGVGQVEGSDDPRFRVGSFVHGMLGWQEWCALDLADEATDVQPVPAEVTDPKLMLTVAGLTGLTAYFGMTDVGRPVKGDTVLVTAAAGATGSVAGQIARLLGAERIIGTAGGEHKQAWVREVAGFDECVSHYDENVRRLFRGAAPEGFNVVFDNVGGTVLDAAIYNTALHARIALCGSISTGYRPERPEVGLHYYQRLTTNRVRMEGFLVTDYEAHFPEARKHLLAWHAAGELHVAEDIVEELEHAPSGLQRLFDGKNLGKQLLHVGDPR